MEPKDIIKKARKAKHLTQEQFATEIGIELRTYQRYEAGEFPKFKSDTILEIDKKLGTNVYDILYDKKYDTPESSPSILQEETAPYITTNNKKGDYLIAYLNEKEARRQDAERDKDRLYNIIEKYLTEIATNSINIKDIVSAVHKEMQAENGVIMDTLDQIAKQPIGTTSAKASTVERAIQGLEEGTGKKTGISKNRK